MFYIKKLVLAEKPSVARDIAAVLGNFQKKDGYLENQEYVIAWAFGHLVELAEPHEYDQVYVKWSLDHLPIIPETFRTRPVKEGNKQLKVLKDLFNSEDVSVVVNACDAGREGELIFRRIYQFCNCNKPIERLWLSETTPAAVKNAFNKLRKGSELDDLFAAAEARSQADWLVGINATRAFSVRHYANLSVGRVQTPTLGLVVAREKEIREFQSMAYWELWTTFRTDSNNTYQGKWIKENSDRLFSKEDLEDILKSLDGATTGVVVAVEQKETKEQSPMLFNLNDLQKEANRRYGMTAQQTLDAAQELYEKHKLLTYPRTDSRHLTTALESTLVSRMDSLSEVIEYNPLIPKSIQGLGKRYVDDAKVTDHHAIIPTATKANLLALSNNTRQVYDLVVRRFLAIFYSDARYAVTKVITQVNAENFISKGKVELDSGWKLLYKNTSTQEKEEKEQEQQMLPPLTEKETISVQKIESPEKQTKPPKRFTEATLLAAMEDAGKFVEDKNMADSLKSAGGIGTPATRAAIIERLIKVNYLERQKKILIPTGKGEALIDLVPEQVKSVELTAAWEERLSRIEAGQESAELWLTDIKKLTEEVVKMAKEQEVSTDVKQKRQAIAKCPLCGSAVIEGTKGYGCSAYKEGCKFVIWKEIAGKKISLKQAQDLIEKGKTSVIKGFKSKAGNKFDAILKLSDDKKVEFEFPNQHNKKSLGKCPLCGKEIIESAKGYGCSGYKEGCKFVIWKEIASKKISSNQAQKLLEKGKTDVIKGFKSKSGKKFDASLAIGHDGKVGFEFDRG